MSQHEDVKELRRRAAEYDALASELIQTRRELALARLDGQLARNGVELNDDQVNAVSHLAQRDQDWTTDALMAHCRSLGWIEPGDTSDDMQHVPQVNQAQRYLTGLS